MKDNIIPSFEILRKVEILVKGKWVDVKMYELEIDDVFRMFEYNGEPAHEGKMWIVLDEPYLVEGAWGVSCEPILGVIEQ